MESSSQEEAVAVHGSLLLGHPQHKKRLSRKEQKARKKLKHKHENDSKKNTATVVESAPSQPETVKQSIYGSKGADYSPTPLPKNHELGAPDKHCKSLGNWFPKATVIKAPIHYTNADKFDAQEHTPTASLILFYQYVDPLWSMEKLDTLISYITKIAKARVLGGRIRVAREGVNATLSSVDTEDYTAQQSLEYFCKDLQHFDKVFHQTDFKFINDLSPDRHFAQLKVFPVQELVFYGINGEEAPLSKGGVHLPPTEFHNMLDTGKEDTVVIDVRNHYEAAIGRFDGQEREPEKCKGAKYIDPKMRKSTDFKIWLDQEETKQQLEGKNVLMYCTGGVRCERASAVLNRTLGDKVKGVFQLQGGIEAYLKTFKDGGHWRGKNFVFDKREAVSADNPDGDGGVVKRKAIPVDDQSTCCVCNEPWDRYVGKKKCSTCGVPVLMCNSCMSQKPKPGQLIRCPLCVEQDVTVCANEVEFTDNGIKGKTGQHTEGKAAPSVLKWGGGHASAKKERRRFSKLPCKFGTDCRRQDCFFAHPDM
jgi:predicted sulfurtransferase